jgi:DNA (cytosine-5)-methyltransferase 1
MRLDGAVASAGERVPVEQQFLIPDPKHRGRTWKRFVQILRAMGYEVQVRILCAADHGAATSRTRLFMVARCDGEPIEWPDPAFWKTPKRGERKWNPIHEHIDWSIPSKSIFGRNKPLAEATQRRIAHGLKRYVLDSGDPFIVPIANWSREAVDSVRDPLRTVTAWPRGGSMSIVAPALVQIGYGERAGQAPRSLDIGAPLGTIVAGAVKHGLVSAFIEQANGGFNKTPGHDAREPISSITHSGSQQRPVTAHLLHLRGNCDARDLNDPLATVSAGGQHHGVVEYKLSPEVEEGALRCAAFLIKYYGEGGQHGELSDPLATVTTKDRLALVTVWIKGDPYVVVDICLRMLAPRELYSASSFRKDYIIDRGHDGRVFSKATQVEMCGNAVPPLLGKAVIQANYRPPARMARAA